MPTADDTTRTPRTGTPPTRTPGYLDVTIEAATHRIASLEHDVVSYRELVQVSLALRHKDAIRIHRLEDENRRLREQQLVGGEGQ